MSGVANEKMAGLPDPAPSGGGFGVPLHLETTRDSSRAHDTVGLAAVASGTGGVAVTPELAMGATERDHPPPESGSEPVFPRLSLWRTVGIVITATMASSLSGAGSMALSIALPDIQRDLNIPQGQLQWVSSAFALTNGCFLLLAGRVADVYGRKQCFIAGIVFNAIWSLIGAFMKNTAGFAVTRALAGTGTAFSIPSAIGIIASSFTGRTRTSAFAAFSAGGPIGGGLGLVIGGLLTEYTEQSWRAALYTFSGTAFLCAITGVLVILPDTNLDPDRRIDWGGATIVTVALVLLMFAVSDAQTAPNGWKTGYIIALIIVSVFMIAAFFVLEGYIEKHTTRPPLMRLGLWTRGRGKLAATYIIGGITWMGFATIFYNATLFYQEVQGVGVIGAMLRFLPTCISGMLCNVVVAKIVHIVPNQLIICVGIGATALANVFFAIAPRHGSYWRLPFNAMWLGVLGADFLMAIGSIFVSTLALPEEQSLAGALFQTLVQLGGALGLAFVSVVQTSVTAKAIRNGDDEVTGLLKGLHGAFWFGAGSCFVALIISIVVLRGMGKYGTTKSVAGSDDSGDTTDALDDDKVIVETK